MDQFICPECGGPIARDAKSCHRCYLFTCNVCGSRKTFHLCPHCDRQLILSKQTRLEQGITKAKENQETAHHKFNTQIHVRDVRARYRINKQGNDKRYLLRSLIYGCLVSVPLIAVGLQMSILSIMFPLGIMVVLIGLVFLGIAIRYRLIYDNLRDARKWLELSNTEKLRYMMRTHMQSTSGSLPSPDLQQLDKAH